MADADRAIALDPDYAHAYDTRAQICLKLGLRDKAIEDLRHAVALDPGLKASAESLRRLVAGR